MIQKSKVWLYPWFKFAEKYLKTDTIYLAKGGFWLVVSQVVAMVSGFLVSIAFAHFFTKESYGAYKFVLSATAILSVFSLSEIGTAVARATARGFGGSLRQGFWTSLKWSVLFFLACISLALYYFINDNLSLAISFLLAGSFIPLTSSGALYSSFLSGKKDFRFVTIFSFARNTIPAVAIILTLFFTKNLIFIMASYFVSSSIISLLCYFLTLKMFKDDNDYIDSQLLSYSKHLSVVAVIGKVAAFLDKILIFHYLGAAPLAIYAFAVAPVEQLQGGKKILTSLIQPKLNGRSFEKLQGSAGRKVLFLILYALALAGLYIIFAPFFYKFLYPQYIDSTIYSQVYSLSLLAIVGSVMSEILVAHKKTKELYIQGLTIPVVQIGLYFLLLPLYGLMGLVLANVIIRFLSGMLAFYFVKRPLKS